MKPRICGRRLLLNSEIEFVGLAKKRTTGRWEMWDRAGHARSFTMILDPSTDAASRHALLTAIATVTWKSGTLSSCSSTAARTGQLCRFQSHRLIPVWVSRDWLRLCRERLRITIPIYFSQSSERLLQTAEFRMKQGTRAFPTGCVPITCVA